MTTTTTTDDHDDHDDHDHDHDDDDHDHDHDHDDFYYDGYCILLFWTQDNVTQLEGQVLAGVLLTRQGSRWFIDVGVLSAQGYDLE
ncbi:hypothetical protein AK812_SmicGene45200 [Symbiodinium microadriaticum]|uniref:Uncharacterized protein n=1 Tax=Symbiodinium microadriaticum TaxID=2951 RepID=A0A1Q9BWP8_SYMMI|nr:hypothetical protein AK812_SmicGene45200 [Symbiodinium microadriaticum]